MQDRTRLLVALAVLVLALSCAADQKLTEIMVVVRSDVALDSVEIQVDGLGAQQIARATLKTKPLPRTLGIVHDGGGTGPITVTALGMQGSDVVVQRKAVVSFVLGHNVTLVLDLAAECVHMPCTAEKNQTCIAGACTSSSVSTKTLRDWPGSISKLQLPPVTMQDAGMDASQSGDDAGMSFDDSGSQPLMSDAGTDAGTCAAGSARCKGDKGCDTKLDTLQNCGGCGVACAFGKTVADGNGTLSCATQTCELSCKTGHLDLDGALENGCEGLAFAYTPSNIDVLASAVDNAAKPPLTVDCDATIDTSGTVPASLTICGTKLQPLVVAQSGGAGGPQIVVLPMAALDVQAGHTLHFVGTRPVALLVFGDAKVAGTLNASAAAGVPGAGGNVSCAAGQGSVGKAGTGGGGGGGGGFGSAGAAGGTNSGLLSNGGGAAGSAEGTAALAPLRGGCAGGAGGDGGSGAGGVGGAGGGSIQLSVAGTLTVAGVVAAAGGGGQASLVYASGGGGGGSGGAMLLEGSQLVVSASAWLTVNGGSGAEAGGDTAIGLGGDDGAAASATPAVGGSGGASYGGDGGNGAAGSANATSGGNGSGFPLKTGGGGGGGGGVGRIYLHEKTACPFVLAGSASPPATSACP